MISLWQKLFGGPHSDSFDFDLGRKSGDTAVDCLCSFRPYNQAHLGLVKRIIAFDMLGSILRVVVGPGPSVSYCI